MTSAKFSKVMLKLCVLPGLLCSPHFSMGRRCQQLRPPAAPPLLRVRISVPGQPDKFVTDPREVDKASIDAWAKVHKGNIGEKAADSAIFGLRERLWRLFPTC